MGGDEDDRREFSSGPPAPMTGPGPAPSAAGPDVAAVIRDLDGTRTPLGPREDWPAPLRNALDLILPARAEIVLFWGPDSIALYNDAYAPTIGTKHPGAFGRPARESWTELWDDLGPLLASVRATGETVWAKDRPFAIERGNGLEEVFFDISFSAIRGEDGGVAGVMCIVTETTARVRAERRLEAREKELARVQRIGRLGGLTVDLQGGFRNRRSPEYLRLHGLPPLSAEESHEAWVQRLHPEDRDGVERHFRETIAGTGTDYTAEYRIVRPSDGRVRWIAAMAEIERGADGEALRLVGAHMDVTERREAEEALRTLNSTLAHQVAERTRERDRIWRLSRDLFLVADRDGRWLSVNPACERILGWSEAELVDAPPGWSIPTTASARAASSASSPPAAPSSGSRTGCGAATGATAGSPGPPCPRATCSIASPAT